MSISPTEPRKITLTAPILPTQCKLGEGPLWDHRTSTLHFVDIDERLVYHYTPGEGRLQMEEFEDKIGCLALRKSGGLACVTKTGFAVITSDPSQPSQVDKLDGATGTAIRKGRFELLARPLASDPAREKAQRFNDGACDAKGRFFAGTLGTENPSYGGQLWMYDPNIANEMERLRLIDDDIIESNGLGWSPNSDTLFYTDSKKRVIYAYDFDLESGSATNRRVHLDIVSLGIPPPALPDGLCIDSEGGIWSASWAGSQVTRFTKDGKVDVIVEVPYAYNVTACCFGGPNRDQLFITTAAVATVGGDGVDPFEVTELEEKYPQSGDLFMIDFRGEFQDGTWRYPFGG